MAVSFTKIRLLGFKICIIHLNVMYKIILILVHWLQPLTTAHKPVKTSIVRHLEISSKYWEEFWENGIPLLHCMCCTSAFKIHKRITFRTDISYTFVNICRKCIAFEKKNDWRKMNLIQNHENPNLLERGGR